MRNKCDRQGGERERARALDGNEQEHHQPNIFIFLKYLLFSLPKRMHFHYHFIIWLYRVCSCECVAFYCCCSAAAAAALVFVFCRLLATSLFSAVFVLHINRMKSVSASAVELIVTYVYLCVWRCVVCAWHIIRIIRKYNRGCICTVPCVYFLAYNFLCDFNEQLLLLLLPLLPHKIPHI